jgi:hypothetical protein
LDTPPLLDARVLTVSSLDEVLASTDRARRTIAQMLALLSGGLSLEAACGLGLISFGVLALMLIPLGWTSGHRRLARQTL